jgi:protein gp37
MILTKQAHRLRSFDDFLLSRGETWPRNVWGGVSVTNQKTANTRIAQLVMCGFSTRYLSLEPLWERVDISGWLHRFEISRDDHGNDLGSASGGSDIDLVIMGGESRQGKAPVHPFDLQWARETRDLCDAVGVSYFLKQLGSDPVANRYKIGGLNTSLSMQLKDSHGGDWVEWPEDLRVRQFPRPEITVSTNGMLFK